MTSDRGTLVNPVLRGFMPDPSLIRVGEWFYIATSSFEWFPTIPIHRSRDLITWEYAGHVDSAAPGGHLQGVPDSGGIWAPSLSHADGVFWVVYSIVRSVGTRFFDQETFVTTAPGVAGPWSAPRRVSGTGFDPALFHHEGRRWLVNLRNDHRPGGNRFDGIVLTELSAPVTNAGLMISEISTSGPTTLLLQREELIEGPKLLHHGDWFYLVVAEGGTGANHGVLVARSRELHGPYEVADGPLLTSRDSVDLVLWKAGHAELVATADGEWYLSHLASRPLLTPDGPRNPLGRESCIQAVDWVDGWPRLRHGGWHPAVEVSVPAVETADDVEPVVTSALGWPWSTPRAPVDRSWVDITSRPGWIRLRGRYGPESLWDQSLLAQRLPEHTATVEVVVDAAPRAFTQSAGLSLYYNTSAYIQLHLTWHDRLVLSVIDRDAFGVRESEWEPLQVEGPLMLRAKIHGAGVTLWAGAVGSEPRQIGPALDFSRLSDDHGEQLRFTGVMVGIAAMDLVDGAFTADFSDFRLVSHPEEAQR